MLISSLPVNFSELEGVGIRFIPHVKCGVKLFVRCVVFLSFNLQISWFFFFFFISVKLLLFVLYFLTRHFGATCLSKY